MEKEENLDFLRQLVLSLESAQHKLDESYKNQSQEYFVKVKKFIKDVQNKILEVLE